MFKTLINIFRIPELRNKVLFTLFMLAIYRIGYHVPLPGVDQDRLRTAHAEPQQAGDDSAAGRLASYVVAVHRRQPQPEHDLRPGHHALHLGVDHLPAADHGRARRWRSSRRKARPAGKKIQEWTRYATVPLCIVQAVFWLSYMHERRRAWCMREFAQHARPSGSWASSR